MPEATLSSIDDHMFRSESPSFCGRPSIFVVKVLGPLLSDTLRLIVISITEFRYAGAVDVV